MMMEVSQPPPPPATAATNPELFDEFLQTGRTGRRNAVPEIKKEDGGASSGTAELQGDLEKLTVEDNTQADTESEEPTPSTSGVSSISTAIDEPSCSTSSTTTAPPSEEDASGT